MSILIHGMEMPKSCNACMFDVYGLCLINKNIEGKDELTHSCPLVPVPPHGRLIDAKSLENMHFTESMYDAESKLFVPFVEVATAIFDAPTILGAEEGE